MVRMSLVARQGFSHSNRVGYLGYGHKIRAEEVVPADTRAFRDLKICEVNAWVAAQDLSPNGLLMAARRRYLAWRWKYSIPVEQNWDGHIGGNGVGIFALSGSGIAQAWLFITMMFYFYNYGENCHHRYKKYHW